jgi:transcriptional regulator with XRE-family HTH domain
MFISMDTVQERLRYYRESSGLSLREFQAAINAELPDGDALSLGTISNYEKPSVEGIRRPGPRVEFLTALKTAFPEIRLEWVMFGDGQPTEVAELLASPDGLDEAAGGGGFGARVLQRYPDIELLPPEGAAVFMAALTRLAMGEPDKALDEDLLLELAGDLRWLLFLPARLWGFRHDPPYDVFSDYTVAMLHGLMQLMPVPGHGDAVAEYHRSPAPRLRVEYPVGF